MELRISATEWYETIRFGDGVTLIHEPWIKPFYRCNIWHVRGPRPRPAVRFRPRPFQPAASMCRW